MNNNTHNAHLVLVAAGSGERLGHDKPKALVPLNGRPLFLYSLQTFLTFDAFQSVVITYPEGYERQFEEALNNNLAESDINKIKLVIGGATRQESVSLALNKVSEHESPKESFIFIHDAARCFVTRDIIQRTYQKVIEAEAVTVAVPLSDSLKRVSKEDLRVLESVDRENLWRIQTPQAFRYELIQKAHEMSADTATDDAALVEKIAPVTVVEGLEQNFKVTTPWDLKVAEMVVA